MIAISQRDVGVFWD